MFGFALLMGLLVAVQERRYAVFAIALVAAGLTRENLLVMLVPFFFITRRYDGWQRAALITVAVAAPAALAFWAVRLWPPIAPYNVYANWLASFRIDVNVGRLTGNVDGQLWRFLLVAPLTLGLFFAIPLARWRRTRDFLRERPEWIWFLVSGLVLAVIGGWDDDRFFVWFVPAMALLTFRDEPLWSNWRAVALTALQIVIVRFAWPVRTDEPGYFQYLVAYMDQTRMWLLALGALGLIVAALTVLLTARDE